MSYCASCGNPVAPGALFCSSCGKPVAAAANAIAAAAAEAPAHGLGAGATVVPNTVSPHYTTESEGNAVTWPFHQKDWLLSVWMLLIGWILVPFPFQITIGWLLDAAGRRARGEADKLPRNRDLLHIWFQGLIVWVMLILFFSIPLTIIVLVTTARTAALLHETQVWASYAFLNELVRTANLFVPGLGFGSIPESQNPTFAEFVRHAAVVYSTDFLAPFVYVILGTPLFAAATLRFAVTGKVRSYFSAANFGFALRHFFGFTWLFVVSAATFLLFYIPVIGIFVWLTFGIWIVAHTAGNLARQWSPHVERPSAV